MHCACWRKKAACGDFTDPDALIDDDEETDEEGTGRDILGEMEIAARIMITGGDEREDARMTRADRLLIRNAIFLAAKTVKESGQGPSDHRGCGGRPACDRPGSKPARTPA